MNPIVALAIALDEEFIIILLAVIGSIEQDGGIAYGLLHTRTTDIHGAARQMVARISPSHGPVHIRRSVAARDNDGLHVLRRLIVLARLQAVDIDTYKRKSKKPRHRVGASFGLCIFLPAA